VVTPTCRTYNIVLVAPTDHLVFDVNDFDETDPGPSNGISNDSSRRSRSPLRTSVTTTLSRNACPGRAEEYRLSIRRFAGEDRLATWYAALDIDAVMADLADSSP